MPFPNLISYMSDAVQVIVEGSIILVALLKAVMMCFGKREPEVDVEENDNTRCVCVEEDD